MNRFGAISVRAWLSLGLSALLGASGWFVTQHLRPFMPALESELTSLTAEHELLRGFDDQVLAAWRQKADSIQAQAWTAQALAALPEQFGPGWHSDWQSNSQVLLRRTNPKLEEWPLYLAFIARWSREPGVTVEAVALDGFGGRFSRVLITLRFRREDAPNRDAGRAVPSHGPHRVAPAEGPAAARTVGPVTSFRPDPPGSGPVLNHQPKITS